MTVPPAAPAPVATPSPTAPAKEESVLLNLVCNVVVPSVVLTMLSKPMLLGPFWAMVAALVFPCAYGIYDLVVRRKWNFFSLLGIGSVLLTGGLGLAQVDSFWFAVKDAAVPVLFGLAVYGSLWTRTPLIRTLLYNDKVVDTEKVSAALAQRGAQSDFDRLLVHATWMMSGAFFLSAVIHFILDRVILKSPVNTPEFAAELGRVMAMSPFVVVIPMMLMLICALWYLLNGIKRLTGLTLDDVFREPPPKEPKATPPAGA